jgi:hypothetical protein
MKTVGGGWGAGEKLEEKRGIIEKQTERGKAGRGAKDAHPSSQTSRKDEEERAVIFPNLLTKRCQCNVLYIHVTMLSYPQTKDSGKLHYVSHLTMPALEKVFFLSGLTRRDLLF